MSIENYRDLTILSGINTYPGSGPLSKHDHEIKLFDKVLDNVRSPNPVMIEVGCHWALWSLMFRDRFRSGKNILIELGKRALLVGQKNFELNNFKCSSYFGGLFIEESGSYSNRAADLEYNNRENDHLLEHIPTIYSDTDLVGPNLEFDEIYELERLSIIDVFHMDIQGSEGRLVPYLISTYPNRVLNFVVATHSHEIHKTVLMRLIDAKYMIIDNERFGSVGGDGYIYATMAS